MQTVPTIKFFNTANFSQVTGKTNVSDVLPTGQLSNVPWRRAGVKYANNECYFDVIEEIDAIIDKQGATIFAEIQGYVNCCCKLSGKTMGEKNMNYRFTFYIYNLLPNDACLASPTRLTFKVCPISQ